MTIKRTITKNILSILHFLTRGFKTLFKSSDRSRWSNETELSEEWDTRTKILAEMITTQSKIIEFGAGRLSLKKYIPAGCSYTPSDIVDRGDNTIVCDLNKNNLPQFKTYDVAVFSGVLEYIYDVPRLINYLSNNIDTFILSYAPVEYGGGQYKRTKCGWVNHYTSQEIISLFSSLGLKCITSQKWHKQMLYKFEKYND